VRSRHAVQPYGYYYGTIALESESAHHVPILLNY